jgi:pentatricopeptide repeat protein
VVILDLHFKRKDESKAWAAFRMAEADKSLNLTLYAHMVRNLVYLGNFEAAIDLFDKMNSGGNCDVGIQSLLVSKLIEAKRHQEALTVLKDTRPRQAESSSAMSVVNCMTLIHSAGSLHALDIAFEVFELCRRHHGKVDALMFNNLIDASVSCRQPQRAVQLFSRMRQSSVQPDLITYNTIVRAYAQVGKLSAAFALLEDMHSCSVKPNVVTFNSLIDAAVSNYQPAQAWGVLPLMARAGVSPDGVTFSSLIKGIKQDKSGKSLERGFECLEQLKRMGLKPDEGSSTRLWMLVCIAAGWTRRPSFSA